MPRRAATRNNRWIPILAWTVGTLIVLFIAAILIGQSWLNRYLLSPEFRALIEEKSGRNVRAQVAIAPLRFQGTQFTCDSMEAQGTQEAAFSKVSVQDVRGEFSFPSIIAVIFGERKARIPQVDVQQLSMEFFDRDRLQLDLPPREEFENRSIIENLNVRDVRLSWPDGGLTGAAIHAVPVEGGWQIDGSGGKIQQKGLPSVDVGNARLVRKGGSVFIQEARLHQDGGELAVSGEIAESADLSVNISDLTVTPFLPEDWRAKLHGLLNGEVRLKIPLKTAGAPKVTGKLHVDRAVVEALPVLNKLADYLNTERFRRVELNQASGDVRYDENGLVVENLVLESKQLLSVRGRFTYSRGVVNGTFEVGVTPGPLQWLPGSREKVFTTEHDGYAWAPMNLSGTMDHLKEDLSGKLVAAVGGAVVDKIESTATDAVGGAVDAAKKGTDRALDLLFGK